MSSAGRASPSPRDHREPSDSFALTLTRICTHLRWPSFVQAIGLVCGGLSIVFTMLNLKVARLRQRVIGVSVAAQH